MNLVPNTYEPEELQDALSYLSAPVRRREASRIAAEGRVRGPLLGIGAPKESVTGRPEATPLALGEMLKPPQETFLLGRMLPLAKSSVLYGPTGAGKSAWLSQLVFTVAGNESQLHGLAVGIHGPVLVVSAEDSHADWVRKGAAVSAGTEVDVEAAAENVHVLDLTDGEARLSEQVTVRERDVTRRVARSTDLQDQIIETARALGVVFIVVETASRLITDETNADFSALQSALGRIARLTGAALVVTHHQTKQASRDGDTSIESARGGGSFVANARNALVLAPADPDIARQYGDRVPAEDVFTLHHVKSTSSTRREDAIHLARLGTPFGAVFCKVDEIEANPAQVQAMEARRSAARAIEVDRLRRLFTLAETALQARPRLTATYLETRHADLGVSRRDMRSLIERALREGVLKTGQRVNSGVALALGFNPNLPANAQGAAAVENKENAS